MSSFRDKVNEGIKTTVSREARERLEEAARAERVAQLAGELVEVLQEHDVDRVTFWELKVVGQELVEERLVKSARYGTVQTMPAYYRDIRKYAPACEGWVVYREQIHEAGYVIYESNLAVSTDGKLFSVGNATGHQSVTDITLPSDALAISGYYSFQESERILTSDYLAEKVVRRIQTGTPIHKC